MAATFSRRFVTTLMLAFVTACQQPAIKPTVAASPSLIVITVVRDGVIRWNGEVVTPDELDRRLADIAKQSPQPQVSITPDRFANYGIVAHVMAAAQRAGLRNMGVIGGT